MATSHLTPVLERHGKACEALYEEEHAGEEEDCAEMKEAIHYGGTNTAGSPGGQPNRNPSHSPDPDWAVGDEDDDGTWDVFISYRRSNGSQV